MSQRSDDIFNPEFKKKKEFWSEKNKKRIKIFVIVSIIFLYGARDYVFKNVIYVEIRSVRDVKVPYAYIKKNGESHYIIINKSLYNIVLKIQPELNTTYDGRRLIPNQNIYVMFISDGYEGKIDIIGEKVK